ncbi:protein VAC14 homolog [Oscarella lobularis]|uniref:protein VAC14 homolog n=1 Tax=Oscarella lobularis TaxID=121494 RepID=UPI0033143423
MTSKELLLPAVIVKGLNDKLYEKRKTAALELERTIKDLCALGNLKQVEEIMILLEKDFLHGPNPNSKKGGLIGLAAVAIALGQGAGDYVGRLVPPVLSCFYDPDSRVRYYACESLYNIAKVTRSTTLPYFTKIFDDICKLSADPDLNVRNGADLLDRLVKDIITESPNFDVTKFISLLRERIHSNNQFVRSFVVQWVNLLNAVPQVDMLKYLPELLDGLFLILSDKNTDIRKMCDVRLAEFLKEIEDSANSVNFTAMANILVIHSQSADELTQKTALQWISRFLQLAGRQMLPFCAGFLSSILPCVAHTGDRLQEIREVAIAANRALMRLVTSDDDEITPEYLKKYDPLTKRFLSSGSEPETTAAATEVEFSEFHLQPIFDVLISNMLDKSVETRTAVLRWMLNLHNRVPMKMFLLADQLFPVLLKSLSDGSDNVIQLDLEVLAEISSSPAESRIKEHRSALLPSLPQPRPPAAPTGDVGVPLGGRDAHDMEPLKAAEKNHLTIYFTKFMTNLVSLFSTDRALLEERGTFIVRYLCTLLDPRDIYSAFAEILLQEEDLKFASNMVCNLNMILLTAFELFKLRNELKELETQESVDLFCALYQSWCHNAVATVSLCLLTQTYEHTSNLICQFGNVNVNALVLTEIDKLVQLIESPIFTYLRLQLLEPEKHRHLLKSLYGLLMLLPQTSAFTSLHNRLGCIPQAQTEVQQKKKEVESRRTRLLQRVDFEAMLRHFDKVQHKHSEEARELLLRDRRTPVQKS